MKRWLTAILNVVVAPVIFGIGYFLGSYLIVILSLGMILPAHFGELFSPQVHPSWRVVYRQRGRFYMSTALVVLLGWLLIVIAASCVIR